MNIAVFTIIITALLIGALLIIHFLIEKLHFLRLVNITLLNEVNELEREILTYYSDEVIDIHEQNEKHY